MNTIRPLRSPQPLRLLSLPRPRLSISSTIPRFLSSRSSFRSSTERTFRSQPPQSFYNSRSYSTEKQKPNPLPPTGYTVFGLFPKTFPDGPPPKGSFKFDSDLLDSELNELLEQSTQPHKEIPATTEELPTLSNADPDLLKLSYTLLTDVLKRATYILHLRGITVHDDLASLSDDELSQQLSKSQDHQNEEVDENEEQLLEAMYELDDKVDRIESTRDSMQLIDEIVEALDRLEGELDELFKKDDLETVERVIRLAKHRQRVLDELMSTAGKYGQLRMTQ